MNGYISERQPPHLSCDPRTVSTLGGRSLPAKMEEKRRKYSISSDNSDTTDSQTTSTSRCSKIPNTKSGWSRQKEKKPSENLLQGTFRITDTNIRNLNSTAAAGAARTRHPDQDKSYTHGTSQTELGDRVPMQLPTADGEPDSY